MSLFQKPRKYDTQWGSLQLELVWLSDADQMCVYFQQRFGQPYPATQQQLTALCKAGVLCDIRQARDFVLTKMSGMDRFKNATDPLLEVRKLEQELAKRVGETCDLPGHTLES